MRQKLIIAGAAALLVGAAATHVVEVFLPSSASDAVISGMSENERVHCMAHWDTCQAVVAAKVRDAHEVEKSAALAAAKNAQQQQQCDAMIQTQAGNLLYAAVKNGLQQQYGLQGNILDSAACDMANYLSSLHGTTTRTQNAP